MKNPIIALVLGFLCVQTHAKVIHAGGNVTATGLGTTSANAISRISNGGLNPAVFGDIMVSTSMFESTGNAVVAPPEPIRFTLNLGLAANGGGHDLRVCRLHNDSGVVRDSGIVGFTLTAYSGPGGTGSVTASASFVAKNPTTAAPAAAQSFPFLAENVQSVVLAVDTMVVKGGTNTLYNLQVTEVAFEGDSDQQLTLLPPDLVFSGHDQMLYSLESSPDLLSWAEFKTQLGSSTIHQDISQDLSNSSRQFYRARQLGRIPDPLEIIDPKPFAINPPVSNGPVISTADYGLSSSNSPSANIIAMESAIAAAKAQGASKLFIPAGVYRFSANRSTQLLFSGLNNMIVEGVAGQTELILVDSPDTYKAGSGDFLHFTGCQNLVVRNLVIDWDWSVRPLSAIAQVVAVNTTDWTVDLEFPFNTLAANYPIRGSMELNPAVWTRKRVGFETGASYFTLQEQISPNRVRLHYKPEFEYKLNKPILLEYTAVFFAPNLSVNAVDLSSSSHVTFDGVWVHGASFIAFAADNNEYYEFRNCRVERRPGQPPAFQGSSGFEIHNCRGHFKLTGNYVNRAGDDALHYSSGGVDQGVERIDANTLRITDLFYYTGQYPLVAGNRLELLNANMTTVYAGTITAVQWDLNFYPTNPRNRVTISLQEPLPATVETEGFVTVPAYATGGYFIENNHFEGGVGHGIYTSMKDGVIRNNTLINCAYPGVMFSQTWRSERWFIGTHPSYSLISDNLIDGCNTAAREPAALFIGAGIDSNDQNQITRGFLPVTGRPTQQVVVANNIIRNSRTLAVAVWSAKNILFQNNQIVGNHLAPQADYPVATFGDFWIEQADNITLKNNLLTANGGGNLIKSNAATTTGIVIE